MNNINNRRTDIDALRGFCMIWIVWYHTVHPHFVDFPFFLPTMFFISGCCFKPYSWPVFWRKKFNQLVIPFVFFYLLYYLFLIVLNYAKYHNIPSDILWSLVGVFKFYTYNGAFIVNYPLWFILALLVVQTITYGLTKWLKDKMTILAVAFILTLVGYYWLRTIPTPLMIGRALPYLIYYVIGTLVVFSPLTNKNSPLIKLLAFFGANSLIVFGLHDMYLTIFRLGLCHVFSQMNYLLGICYLLLVLLLMWPTILLLNKYVPQLVAKKEFLHINHKITS